MKWNRVLCALVLCAPSAGAGGPRSRVAGSPKEAQLVRDLRAVRKGDKVTLTWSQPRDAENGQSFEGHLAVARICRNISATISDSGLACSHAVRQINLERPVGLAASAVHGKSNAETKVRLIDILPESQDDSDHLQFAVYEVEFRDDRGQRAGFSNPVAVPLAPVLPVKGLHSDLDSRGVYLIWENEIERQPSLLKFDYRIYRSEKGSSKRIAVPYLRAVVHTTEGERWSAVDLGIEWEKTYLYSVTPVTSVYSKEGHLIGEFEGDDSALLEITTHDVFPPAVPERLLAIVNRNPEKGSVDLLWAPNIEKDISGYNVYRREENGQSARIALVPISSVSFQDVNVLAAHKYFYCISAVDVRGNESARSLETGVVFP
jgi:hypothetical protein